MKIYFSVFVFLIGILFASFSAKSQTQPVLPRQSASATLTQMIGLTEITVKYSRPSVKGRKGDIWGKLVPYGQVWRAGANEATTIKFSSDVRINGKTLQAGTYSLFVIPQKSSDWTFIFNADTTLWGTENYDAKKDVLRVNAKVEKCSFCETLAYEFDKIEENSATFFIRWEQKIASIRIEVNTLEEAKKNISKAIDQNPNDWQVLVRSASFYKDQNTELRQALDWVNKALKLKSDHYLPYWVKGEILALEGDFKGAVENGKKALEIGQQQENFTYQELIRSQVLTWQQRVK